MCKKKVFRFQVAMKNSLLMCRCQASGDLQRKVDCFAMRQRTTIKR